MDVKRVTSFGSFGGQGYGSNATKSTKATSTSTGANSSTGPSTGSASISATGNMKSGSTPPPQSSVASTQTNGDGADVKNEIEVGELGTSLFDSSEGYLQDNQWSTSFQGMAVAPFEQRIIDVLMAPVAENEIEIKPDGLLYLPEIKYRRILNRAFGPGGWGLVPRGAHSVSGRNLSREYALICLGRFISQARGEQEFFDQSGLATATEGCKSNALVRCCKDLGVASELWDPAFVSQFKAKYCVEDWVTHAVKGNKRRLWRLKTRSFDYPWVKK
ncbi:hypothetical protein IWW48_005844 [Coemansia sp. RSA 1200]|nr:hypothetical protein IWW48_005844 [Coemansia sp. RSA 1200]